MKGLLAGTGGSRRLFLARWRMSLALAALGGSFWLAGGYRWHWRLSAALSGSLADIAGTGGSRRHFRFAGGILADVAGYCHRIRSGPRRQTQTCNVSLIVDGRKSRCDGETCFIGEHETKCVRAFSARHLYMCIT